MAQNHTTVRESDDIQDALRRARDVLQRAGIQAPRLAAELLLGYTLGCDRIHVISHPAEPLGAEAAARFVELIRQHAAGEPLQYLTGVKEFYGLEFHVTPAVLIPRPETEILVEKAVCLSKQFLEGGIRFADVGTGSGCIAVSFAHEQPLAKGWAVDLSGEALSVAHENAARHGVLERLQFVRADLMDCLPARPCFEFILSNPPYVAFPEAAALPAMVRDHEPELALFAGNSGLEIYTRLIPQARQRLVPGGYLLLEVGAGMSDSVSLLVEREGLSIASIETDLQMIPRCLVARRDHG